MSNGMKVPAAKQIRVRGAEFKRFLDDPAVFAGDADYEDAMIFVDGQDSPGSQDIEFDDLSDAATLLICGGRLVGTLAEVPVNLVDAIRWWRERNPSVDFLLTVPREKVVAARTALAALGLTLVPLS